MRTHRRRARKRVARDGRSGGARQAIGEITPGIDLFVLTYGQFSLIDALVYLSGEIGPCDLSVSVWTAGPEDLAIAAELLAGGEFLSARWILDRSFLTRKPESCRKFRELFGDESIRTTRNHAKFATLRNDRFDLALRTSMNLNFNPRMETLDITDDPGFADFLDAEFDRYFENQQTGIFDGELFQPPKSPIRVGRAKTVRLFPGGV